MFSTLIRKLKKEDGQAIVELALTLPILMMILCGIIDFGWIFTNQNIIDNCSRQGARYAIVHSTDTIAVLEEYTESIAPVSIEDTVDANVTLINSSDPYFIVEVTMDVEVLTPILGVFTQGEIINLGSSCTMKVE